MIANLVKAGWAINRVMSGDRTELRLRATDQDVLCPAELATGTPAICFPEDLNRIQAFSPWRSPEVEFRLINGAPGRHDPSMRYVVEDVLLHGSSLYKGASRYNVGYGPDRWMGEAVHARQDLDEAVLLTSWGGSRFFGNHLLDDMPLALLDDARDTQILMRSRPYGHGPAYREILGLHMPPLVTHARIRRLTFFYDYAQNSLKQRRYKTLRARLRANIAPDRRGRGAGIFLRRGTDGERRVLSNETQLISHLGARGFDIVDVNMLSADEISARILDAPIVISVEGSHISHAIYSIADGGTFLVLQPPDRFGMAYKEFSDRLGMRFALLVGHPAPGGFSVPPYEVDRMLERL